MSILPNVVVNWYYTGSSSFYTAPAGTVTSVSWNTGRRNITDQWFGSTATVYGRSPSSLTYVPEIGQRVRIKTYTESSSYFAGFWGYVSDYRVIYGVLPAYDTWELTLETGYGVAGRQTGTVTSSAGASTSALVNSVAALMPTNSVRNGGGWGTTTSAQTYTEQLANPLNVAMQTDGGYMIDSVYEAGIAPDFYPCTYVTGHNNIGSGDGGTFTDVSTDPATSIRYQEIEFRSAAYNYGQKVVVQPSGLASQTSGSGTYAQTIETINYTTTEAADLAGYYKAKFDYSAAVPLSLTFVGANNNYVVPLFASAGQVATLATIKFRGNTYKVVIEGMSFTANQTDYRCTLTFSSSLQNAFLRLDNPVFGTLDDNRLGF